MADVSSYALPPQKSMLDVAQQLGAMERQKIGVDQDKLKLMNERTASMGADLASLEKRPDLSRELIIKTLNQTADRLELPPEFRQKLLNEIPNTNDPEQLRLKLRHDRLRMLNAVERTNQIHGVPGFQNDNQTFTPTRTTPENIVPAGAPIQIQAPPTTQVATPQGTQELGPQLPRFPAGATPVRGGFPSQYNPPGVTGAPLPQNKLPVAPPPGANNVPLTAKPVRTETFRKPDAVIGQPYIQKQNDDRVPRGNPNPLIPAGPMISQPPLFEAGQRSLTEDQALAGNKAIAIKPALEAYELMPGIMAGPGTAAFTNAVAAAKAFGLLDINSNADPTVLRQVVAKKLAQYLSGNPIGQRSDAAQLLAQAGSPDPNVQVLPALMKLTRDAIALDRIHIISPTSFINDKKTLDKHGEHRATFPQSIDQRALTLDMLTPVEKTALINYMVKNKAKPEAEKFFRTLDLADTARVYDRVR